MKYKRFKLILAFFMLNFLTYLTIEISINFFYLLINFIVICFFYLNSKNQNLKKNEDNSPKIEEETSAQDHPIIIAAKKRLGK